MCWKWFAGFKCGNIDLEDYELVMCSLERTYDSNPTSAIVSPILTPLKSEALVSLTPAYSGSTDSG